jgi:hypothetical protein
MQRLNPFWLAALFVATAGSGAARADLYSPSFIADDGEDATCHILSRSKKPRDVEIQIRFNNSAVAATSDLITIAPGEVRAVSVAGTNSSRLHCAFLGKVTAKTARAAGEITVDGKTKLIVPAQ